MTRLRTWLETYPDEIRAGLQQMYGVDVPAEYKARRWRRLLVLIDQLPSASRLTQAYLTDENDANRLALAQLETGKGADNNHGSMSFREWDLQASQPAILVDAIHALNTTVMTVGGGKPPHIEPFPRPQTVGEKVLDRARAEVMDDFVNLIALGRSPSWNGKENHNAHSGSRYRTRTSSTIV